ncbi:hypothetical protein GLOIN_2v1876362 [Rhizophagus irregularis DAOM 181602=DAOM 197198]|nr:hypothetical protein GLOIN_2v1876362 [Rhizophagus irregularis DAOM 181602=DAOM 197198]
MNLLHYHILCAIESLNRAPSSFIQFKSTELLLHLYNINSEMFSMIEIDFDQYTQKLKKYHEDLKILIILEKEKREKEKV